MSLLIFKYKSIFKQINSQNFNLVSIAAKNHETSKAD